MQTDESYTAIEPRVTEPRPYMEHELLAEIFQMLPESVLADMYDLANALFYNVMQGTADRLATECPEKRREIKAALDTYQVTAEKKLDEVFNVFQQYVSQSTWKIPDDLDVQFDHHKDIDFNISDQDLHDIDQQLEDLRNKIKAQKQFKAILTHTHQKHRRDIERLDAMLERVSFLNDVPLKENVPDVNNTMLFVKEQVEYIKEAVIQVVSEDISSIPPDKRTLHLRSKFQAYMDKLLERSQQPSDP
ncbi:hypothetical protein V8B55DRAFT_1357591 [Mucor lusitanicus]|uniref:Uncharacterized protein n=2 Tax=Mucor circinelloides f. lusitanicus TaxID=29924 RepID=A0A162QTX2_MUCCL|nr:hypothetical protein FB192DRAFT_1432987 [Mucor lusitanicus]OAD05650.1 hypothetical protein MUCCIDRAFT_162319 [Mucor lusitanicus CBS 277.49]